ncbi:gluconokinase [Arthrobacter sp. EH-1B-1]|uniref:Gluconokinase n=1 Tax=Arthrobacter vasquezii TaxID=2977629 RepID=A0ABT6CVP1_9MICC|nr:gluconokinase [Arthrobacter vasquezii]MDF9277635.1 gluconokinase [Arthrobacter vasquezii]
MSVITNEIPPTPTGNQPLVVVMGVSAVGKSSVAAELSRVTGIPWKDGDDLHPKQNVAKMAAGTPLTDHDRWPWLDKVGATLAHARPEEGAIIACSALRRTYRDRIRTSAPEAVFVHLTGDRDLLARRAESRPHHFMPSSLLDSQFATLEPLEVDENGVAIDVSNPVVDIAARAADWIDHHGR